MRIVTFAVVGLLVGGVEIGQLSAGPILSQVGIPEPEGSFTLTNTLTGGYINGDWSWTHNYGPITEPILSATLEIDLVDADTGVLMLYAGTDNTGISLGAATGDDAGFWGGLPPLGTASDNLIHLPSTVFADLADGTFTIYGENVGMSIWGSNRALLTIHTQSVAVPEPSSAALLAIAGMAVAASRRLRHRRKVEGCRV